MSIEFVQIGFLLMESRWFCENRYKERTFKWVDWNSPLQTLSDYAQVSRFFIEIDAVFSNKSPILCALPDSQHVAVVTFWQLHPQQDNFWTAFCYRPP
jgi:hypothetical protein